MDIQTLVNDFEYSLATEYYSIVETCEKSFVSNEFFSINYCNERTIVYFAEKYIEEKCPNLIGNTSHFLLNEFFIKIKNNSLWENDDYSRFVDEVKDDKCLTNIPDTCLYFDNQIVFIEYKVCESSFSYIKLASDYIKYKRYSNLFSIPTRFIYLNFTKNRIDGIEIPTLKYNQNCNPKIEFLKDVLTRKDIERNARVFISEKDTHESKPDIILLNTNGFETAVDEISNNAENFLDENGDERFAKTDVLSKNIFYNLKGICGSNVILSQFVRNNFVGINKLFRFFLNNKYRYFSKDKKADNFIEQDFDDLGDHFTNIIHKLSKLPGETRINKATYNVSYKRSYWIIYLLKHFCKINKIAILEEIIFDDDKVKKDYEELERSIDFYHRKDDPEDFNYFCYQLTFLIFTIYDLLYEKDDNGKILREKPETVFATCKANIIKNVEKIKTILGYKAREPINYDDNNTLKDISTKIVLKSIE